MKPSEGFSPTHPDRSPGADVETCQPEQAPGYPAAGRPVPHKRKFLVDPENR